jgi:hypothetical protein
MIIDPTLPLSQKRALAGSLGGRRTVKRYGKRYMKKLARFGAHRTHSLYRREPVLLNDFAIVERASGKVVALLSGRPVDAFNLPTFAPDAAPDPSSFFTGHEEPSR